MFAIARVLLRRTNFLLGQPLDALFRAFRSRLVNLVPDTAATATLIMKSKSNPRVAAARTFLLFPGSKGPGGIPEYCGMTRPRFLTLLAVPAARSHKFIHDRCLLCLIFILHPPILTIIRDSSSLVLPPGFTAAVTELSTPHGTRFPASTRGRHFPPQHAYHPPSVFSLGRATAHTRGHPLHASLRPSRAAPMPARGTGRTCAKQLLPLLRFFDVDQVMAHFDPGRRDGEQNGKIRGRRRSVLKNNN
ncbi:hypothetical protein DFH08DRAFT_866088 [Mycena albidolilacea]|uniref:Uncharacterized protein n=1 Tax=Mycena albidolilacea TaxID=1033008 RepID=A0AAD7A3Y3_9AGAR|nr:hypothetical protein DFH08DRAFT_866088 [Mycena albidolilacea]